MLGDGANTVSGSTVSHTVLSEGFWAHCVPGSELSEFLSAFYYLCPKANSPSFSQNSPSLPQNSVSSLFSETVLSKQYSARSPDAPFRIGCFHHWEPRKQCASCDVPFTLWGHARLKGLVHHSFWHRRRSECSTRYIIEMFSVVGGLCWAVLLPQVGKSDENMLVVRVVSLGVTESSSLA